MSMTASEVVPAVSRPAERSRIEKVAMRRRKLTTRVHRWLTLFFGTWAILQGASGVVMLTADQQAMISHPGIYDHGDQDLGIAAAVAGARMAPAGCGVSRCDWPPRGEPRRVPHRDGARP